MKIKNQYLLVHFHRCYIRYISCRTNMMAKYYQEQQHVYRRQSSNAHNNNLCVQNVNVPH